MKIQRHIIISLIMATCLISSLFSMEEEQSAWKKRQLAEYLERAAFCKNLLREKLEGYQRQFNADLVEKIVQQYPETKGIVPHDFIDVPSREESLRRYIVAGSQSIENNHKVILFKVKTADGQLDMEFGDQNRGISIQDSPEPVQAITIDFSHMNHMANVLAKPSCVISYRVLLNSGLEHPELLLMFYTMAGQYQSTKRNAWPERPLRRNKILE